MEQKAEQHDKDFSDVKADLENCKMNVSLNSRIVGGMNGRITERKLNPSPDLPVVEDKSDDFLKRIEDLEKRMLAVGTGGGSGGDFDLNALLNQLNGKFVPLDPTGEDILKRLEKVEKKAKKAKDTAKKAYKKAKKNKERSKNNEKEIEKLWEAMKGKVDLSVFDEQMASLMAALSNTDGKTPVIAAPTQQFSSSEA